MGVGGGGGGAKRIAVSVCVLFRYASIPDSLSLSPPFHDDSAMLLYLHDACIVLFCLHLSSHFSFTPSLLLVFSNSVFVFPSISACLPACLFLSVSVCQSVSQSVSLSVCLSVSSPPPHSLSLSLSRLQPLSH